MTCFVDMVLTHCDCEPERAEIQLILRLFRIPWINYMSTAQIVTSDLNFLSSVSLLGSHLPWCRGIEVSFMVVTLHKNLFKLSIGQVEASCESRLLTSVQDQDEARETPRARGWREAYSQGCASISLSNCLLKSCTQAFLLPHSSEASCLQGKA